MSLAYTPPGVSVSEIVTAQISPLLSASALICLVGLTQGYQTRTDQFVLSGTSPVALPGLPVGATVSAVNSVKDSLNPSNGASDGSGYVLTTDYTTTGGTITRVNSGAIADGTLINVTYQYIPSDYYEPIRLYDLGSIESRFGSGLDPTGTTISSPISYAASIAFENGTDSIVIQPLFKRATPGDPTTARAQPNSNSSSTAGSYANPSTWADTLYVLRDIEDINVIVPVIGQSQANVTDSSELAVFDAVQDHCQFMASQDQYIVSILGEDSSASSSVAQKATLQSHANTLRGRYGGALAAQTVLVSPSKFTRALPGFGQSITIGGQYAAAAVSGMLASRPTSSALTRKVVSGIDNVTDARSLNEKNADAAAGLFVIESKNGNVLVRHAITLDQTNSARRELSVVRAKFRMIESVRSTLDRNIVGQIIADGNAPGIVSSTVSAVLEQLRLAQDIVSYSAVDSRLLSLDPTIIQVRYSYRPSFPLNNVAVQFSIDFATGSVTASDTTLTGI